MEKSSQIEHRLDLGGSVYLIVNLFNNYLNIHIRKCHGSGKDFRHTTEGVRLLLGQYHAILSNSRILLYHLSKGTYFKSINNKVFN